MRLQWRTTGETLQTPKQLGREYFIVPGAIWSYFNIYIKGQLDWLITRTGVTSDEL